MDQRCKAEVQEGGQGRVVPGGVGRNGPVIVGLKKCSGQGHDEMGRLREGKQVKSECTY